MSLRPLALLVALLLLATPAAAADITFTVNVSEPVTVTGMPRIAINVGGVTRYANFVSSAGSALTFTYQVQAGDFDPDGISFDTQQIDLNGGTIADQAGNPLASPTFTAPSTANIKVQTYTAAFTTSPITNANAGAVSFQIDKAPPSGASYSYTITSSGGAGTVEGSGSVTAGTMPVTADVSGLLPGTLTLSVTLSKTGQGTGQPRTATAAANVTFSGRVLDGLSASAAAAYSTRLLRNAYTGPLLRVRRASDNAVRDIAVGIGGGLATANLMEFCGTSSCFVTTWFDQSGNARDALQATAASQPRIVNAGTLDTIGTGRPSLRTFGAQSLATAAFTGGISQFTANGVIRNDNPSDNWGRFVSVAFTSHGSDWQNSASVAAILMSYNPITVTVYRGGVQGALRSLGLATAGVVTSWFDATNGYLAVNGSAPSSWSFAAAALGATLQIWLGSDKQSAATTGALGDALWFHSALSASDRQALEANQKAWYGTP